MSDADGLKFVPTLGPTESSLAPQVPRCRKTISLRFMSRLTGDYMVMTTFARASQLARIAAAVSVSGYDRSGTCLTTNPVETRVRPTRAIYTLAATPRGSEVLAPARGRQRERECAASTRFALDPRCDRRAASTISCKGSVRDGALLGIFPCCVAQTRRRSFLIRCRCQPPCRSPR